MIVEDEFVNLEERKKELERKKAQLEKELEEKQKNISEMNRQDKREEIKNAKKSERYICSKCKKKTITYKNGCIWCGKER